MQYQHTNLSCIAACTVYWLKPLLTVPYENALCRLQHFDVMLIELVDTAGVTGWGEACPVFGYSPESPEQAWHWLTNSLAQFIHLRNDEFDSIMQLSAREFPFVVSAFFEAYADLTRLAVFRPSQSLRIPLIGTVNTLDPKIAPQMALELIENGYHTLKIKVGYDPESDSKRVCNIVEVIGKQAQLRLDANQGYSLEQAIRFAQSVPAEAVEFFEQPVAARDWQSIETLMHEQPLPLMLDESIYDDEDIDRTIHLGKIAAVKLKMSKSGGPMALTRQVQRCQQHGLAVVIGNGVATDIGCYHEAAMYHQLGLSTAAEMNGFLKIPQRLYAPTMIIDQGSLVLPEVEATHIRFDVIHNLQLQQSRLL